MITDTDAAALQMLLRCRAQAPHCRRSARPRSVLGGSSIPMIPRTPDESRLYNVMIVLPCPPGADEVQARAPALRTVHMQVLPLALAQHLDTRLYQVKASTTRAEAGRREARGVWRQALGVRQVLGPGAGDSRRGGRKSHN